MTPTASNSPKAIRNQIGRSVWLLALFAQFLPPDWNGEGSAWVANGNVVSDAELAERLQASQRTIVSWRRKLRKAGLLGWHVCPGQGRTFWIAGMISVSGTVGPPKVKEQKLAEESGAGQAETDATTPAPRWLQ